MKWCLQVPGEIKRREVELHPQVSPDEIISRDMELGCESWTSFVSGCSSTAVHDIVLVTLPSMAVETAIALCTGCWAMAREHHLNTSIVLAAVHGLSGPFLVISAVEPSLSCPLPPPPLPSPSQISNLTSVDVKQYGQVMPIISLSLVLFACMCSACLNQAWNRKSLDPTGLAQLDPTWLAQLDPTWLAQLDPTGQSTLDPTGLSQLDPTGLSQLDPTWLAQLDPTGQSMLDPTGLSQLTGRQSTLLCSELQQKLTE